MTMATSPPGNSTETIDEALGRLQTIIDATQCFVSCIGRDLRYQMVNHTYEVWMGKPRSQVVGNSVCEVVGPEIFAAIEPLLTRALAGELVVSEQWVPFPTGGRWVHWIYTPHRAADGHVDTVVGTLHDITTWKQAEEAVRQSEAYKSGILEAALDSTLR